MRLFFIPISVFCILISVFCLPTTALSQDFVQTEGIKSDLHKKNVKRIFFTSKRVATGELKEADFLSEYKLTNKSDLFFIAFMDNSLTNYKHRLLPAAIFSNR